MSQGHSLTKRKGDLSAVSDLWSPPAIETEGLQERLWSYVGNLRVRFIVIVLLPTAVVSIYYGLVASPGYVSHASYLVRSVNSHSAGGIAALLNTIGISKAADDTSAIEDYVVSRDAMQKLDSKLNIRAIYGLSGIDFWSRYPHFWEADSFERMYLNLRDYITVFQDPETGISTLKVEAFRPEDAQAIATSVLGLAEDMVNRMNVRARSDSVRIAQQEVEDSRQAVLTAEEALTKFRNEELLVDPVSYATVLLQTIGQLSQDRASAEVEVQRTKSLSPASPNLPALGASVDALEKRMAEVRKNLAGDDSAMAQKVALFDRLNLERELGQKRYESALTSLQSAQEEAQRQQVYIETISQPNLPTYPEEPERIRRIVTVFVSAFAIYSVLWILAVGAKDHAQ